MDLRKDPKPMPGINSQVNNLNKDVFKALQKVKDPNSVTQAEAKNIRTSVLQDGKIDQNEASLLKALTKDSGEVNVSAAQTADFSPSDLKFGAVKGKAKEVVETLTKPSDLNKLWDQGAEGWKKIIDLSTLSPESKSNITKFTANKLYSSWQKSNVYNMYKPLRDDLAQAYNTVKNSDSETLNQGRELLHDAMKMIDNKIDDKVPDYLYNWLQPK